MSSPEAILAGLDPEQARAVTAPQAPLVVVAGAGTGKTRTITHRIAYQVAIGAVEPTSVLAVTHSTKAAGEMRDRLGRLGAAEVTARTFHASALAFLKRFWRRSGRSGELVLADNRYPLVRAAIDQVATPAGSRSSSASSSTSSSNGSRSSGSRRQGSGTSTDVVFDMAQEIGWAKSSLVSPTQYVTAALRTARVLSVDAELVAKVYAAYEQVKTRHGRYDFEDLLTLAADLLETDAEIAEVAHSGFTSFVVDEYQDTDPAQERFLRALLGPSRDICVVGDPRQSIYTFKGADTSILENFTKMHPDALVVNLVKDYRSTPQVVAAANCLIPAPPSGMLVGQQAPGPAPRIVSHIDEAAEERFVAMEIKALLAAGTPGREIAVLYRFNSQSARFEAAFTAAGIPYKVADNERFFERPEIRQPLIAFGQAARLDMDAQGVALLHQILSGYGFDPDRPPEGAGAARSRFDAQMALVELVAGLAGVEEWTAGQLLAELNRRAIEAHAPTPDGVTLSTLHQAKGLEYDAVFLVGLVEGSMPSAYATEPEAIDEERRLLYVGVTRARYVLTLTWSEHRPGPSGATWSSKHSRFLDDLTVATARGGKGAGGSADKFSTRSRLNRAGSRGVSPAHRARATVDEKLEASVSLCASCRSGLRGLAARRLGRCSPACLAGADAALWRALCEWRDREATARSAPDRALFTLVATRPTTSEELSTVAGLDKKQLGSWAPELLKLVATHPAS